MRITKFIYLVLCLALGPSLEGAFVTVTANITTSQRWTRDNVYILVRDIYIEPSVTLTVEPGTVIRGVKVGVAGSGINQPGALIVSRDAKLVANGTPDDPVVMTSIDDPHVPGGAATIPASYVNAAGDMKVVVPQDYSPSGVTGNNGFAYNQQWGGLVILGNAYVANYNTGGPPQVDTNSDGLPDEPHPLINPTWFNTQGFGRDYVEGFDPVLLNDPSLTIYGGKDDSDNSGVYRFVSVRYGGIKVNPQGIANNEINAITAGGVGASTVMEFCEAAFNVDDGFEFFGGKLNTRHLYSLYNMDDSFDADEGFRGNHQFWFILQGNTGVARSGYPTNNTWTGVTFTDTTFDNLFEMDGAENNNNAALPYTSNNVYNLTVLSGGSTSSEFTIVQDARILIRNAVGSKLADLAELSQTTLDPVGTIADVANFHYYFDGNLATTEDKTFTDLVVPLSTSAIEELSRQVVGDAFYTKHGVDPRLAESSAALVEDGALPPAGFVQVNYAGYMHSNTFLSGWSIADYLEVLAPTNIVRPALTISGTTNPIISFASAGATVKYVIEKSTDRRMWTPVNSGVPISGAGTITFTDTSAVLTADIPLYYRAYAL
jgi:hypothetical protein